MNSYLIITVDGYCETPNGEDIDNAQVLGAVRAESRSEAVEKYFQLHPQLLEDGYKPSSASAYQII